MNEITVTVQRTGRVRMIYDERLDLRGLGQPHIRRASHVEPDDKGQWWADLSPVGGSPTLGPFHLRSAALEAETQWLKTHHL